MAKSEKIHGVNPYRLKFAREHYGLTSDDILQRAKIAPEELHDFESGNDFPTYAKLSKLADLYNRPLLYFFFLDMPEPYELQSAFRSLENEIGKPLEMQMRLMMEKADEYRMNLEELFQEQNPPLFYKLSIEKKVATNEQLGSLLRDIMKLPINSQKKDYKTTDKLLEYIREQLYGIGIYVFKDSFRLDTVSGLCLYNDRFPIILLNNKTTFTRQLFTIFHEIYHLWKKEADIYIPENNEEKECDKFASEFLIPQSDFIESIGNNNCEDQEFINNLASMYKVSPEAIAYRLKAMNKIGNNFYKTIRQDGIRKVNSASSGGNFYYTRMSYLGKPYLTEVFAKYYDGKINTVSVGKYTGLKSAHVAKLASSIFGGDF